MYIRRDSLKRGIVKPGLKEDLTYGPDAQSSVRLPDSRLKQIDDNDLVSVDPIIELVVTASELALLFSGLSLSFTSALQSLSLGKPVDEVKCELKVSAIF